MREEVRFVDTRMLRKIEEPPVGVEERPPTDNRKDRFANHIVVVVEAKGGNAARRRGDVDHRAAIVEEWALPARAWESCLPCDVPERIDRPSNSNIVGGIVDGDDVAGGVVIVRVAVAPPTLKSHALFLRVYGTPTKRNSQQTNGSELFHCASVFIGLLP